MLRYIGAALILAGLILLIFTIISGIKKNIKGIRHEYRRIISSGYVSEHITSSQEQPVRTLTGSNAQVKAAPRKRALSKEGLDLLEKVESQREEERKSGNNVVSSAKRKIKVDPEVLGPKEPDDGKKITSALDISSGSSKKVTGTLTSEGEAPTPKTTGVLDASSESTKKETGTLISEIESDTPKKVTGVLTPAQSPQGKETGILETDDPPKKKETSILEL